MSLPIVDALLWFSAIGCGLLAGLYFAFSTFIMRALGGIGQVHGITAMNAINAVIQRSLFMPVFLGTSLTSLLLAIAALLDRGQPGACAMLAGGISYIIGMFGCTMAVNVPLNNALAATDPTTPDAASIWGRYLKHWTRWNHVRTVSSTAAAVLFILAIAARN